MSLLWKTAGLPTGADVREHAHEFARSHPEYADGDETRGRCLDITDEFLGHLEQNGIVGHEVGYHVGGLKPSCDPHGSGECTHGNDWHSFAQVPTSDEGVLAVDHSARQVSPSMGFPEIAPHKDHRDRIRSHEAKP